MLGTLFFLLAIVLVVGALVMRRRVRDTVEGDRPVVGDPLLKEILPDGAAWDDDDEPLDEDRARAEEDRFWDEDWDEPEEWRG